MLHIPSLAISQKKDQIFINNEEDLLSLNLDSPYIIEAPTD
jgi:hypothetical protein